MEERKIETTPSELLNALGSAIVRGMREMDAEEDVTKAMLGLCIPAFLNVLRHLTGIEAMDPEVMELFETDPEEIEKYLQDEEKQQEERRRLLS